jgi:uncharacterized protein YyaL (SSP411 family)
MNRLQHSTSPYLRSHADNPVDWYPWGDEAFAEARRRDVPVLVSIGYSTCHWCHVMARESFSDPVLAHELNANFVAIKVDREEYPDVDASYLAAASAFTENLGWPLNVFVTPDGGPFFGGTYWPPEPVLGHPAFRDVLAAVLDAWTNRRDEVLSNARGITEALAGYTRPDDGELITDFAPLVERLASLEDTENGGFGHAPKFPVATVLGFLLDRDHAQDAVAGSLARRTLAKMAASTLRDPVDGGFFRYATRPDWTEPHYERMLYDNALLLSAYARVGDAETAEGIARFLLDTLRVDGGAFASAQDSESTVDGVRVEGTYYELDPAARALQPAPALDGKVLTGWNGLAIQGLAIAGSLLGHPEWVAAAATAADYLIEHHFLPDRLARTSIDGVVSDAPATLEDFGMLASGLLHLAEATGEPQYAVAARELVDACLPPAATAVDPAETASTQPLAFSVPDGPDSTLAAAGLAMQTDPSEGAYPSGISAMASAAHRLWLLGGGPRYRDAAAHALAGVAGLAEERPMSFGAALGAMSALTEEATQLVVVTDAPSDLADAARTRYSSGSVSITLSSAQARVFDYAGFELFTGRTAHDGRPTAYACRDFVCALPVFEVADLRP